MIKNRKAYEKEMRAMIKRVQKEGYIDTSDLDMDHAEVLMDCVKCGYVIGQYSFWDEKRQTFMDARTLDGKAHPEVYSNVIPLKGMIFLEQKPDWKFIIPTAISVIALALSFLSRF